MRGEFAHLFRLSQYQSHSLTNKIVAKNTALYYSVKNEGPCASNDGQGTQGGGAAEMWVAALGKGALVHQPVAPSSPVRNGLNPLGPFHAQWSWPAG